VLFDPDAVDRTRTPRGGDNEEVRIEAPVPVTVDAEPGALWGRVVRTRHGLLISLIDLSAQEDDVWDAPKKPAAPLAGVCVSVLRRGALRFDVASPEEQPALAPLEPETSERYDTVSLPAFSTWTLLLVREESE
jgi:hypothetical protein